MKITYESNGQTVGDGIRVTRVSGGGQKLEVLVDIKTERWSALALVGDAAPGPIDPPPVEEPEEPPVDPGPVGDDSPDGTTITAAGQSLTFGGKVYSLIDVTDQGLGIAVNGNYLTETNRVAAMFVHDGKLYQTAWDRFWERVGDGWGAELMLDPRKPIDPGVPAGEYPALPEGMKKPGDYKRPVDALNPVWATDEIFTPKYFNGIHTYADPTLVAWRGDGSAMLDARYIGNEWHSGYVQHNLPQRAKGRWGWVTSSPKPNVVQAMFTYTGNQKELDFEYIKRGGVYGWQPNVHMPKPGGGSVQVEGATYASLFIPMTQEECKKVHLYEIELDETQCRFFIDGVQRARVTPSMLPGGHIWDTTTPTISICSVEKHGGWAGHEYPAGTEAQMIVWGIKVPG